MKLQTEIWLYRGVALVALIATWFFNIRFMMEGRSPLAFITDQFLTNSTTNLALDIIFVCIILIAWMVREARRYGIPHLWIYMVCIFAVAVSVSFPLFLVARRKAIAARHKEEHGVTRLTAFFPVVSAVSFVVLNIFLVRFLLEGKPMSDFFTEWFLTNAGTSIALDFGLLVVTLLVFTFSEVRRGQLRKAGGAIVACVFGVAVGLPWILREHDVFQPAKNDKGNTQ